MVRRLFILLLVCAHVTGFAAFNLSEEEVGEPFDPKNIELIWQAPTNQVLSTLNIYEIQPRIFSAAVISNVVATTKLNEPEKIRAFFKPTLSGKKVSYVEKETGKSLTINPERGHISYQNFHSIALPKDSSEGVPNKEKVRELAFKLLPLLDIDEAKLARKPHTNEFLLSHVVREQGKFEKATKKQVVRTIMQGIVMSRAVDGIGVNGRGDCGGVMVCYGSNAEIAQLQVVWPNLKGTKKVSVATSQEMMKWIKEGRAVIEGGEGFRPIGIKKLTISEIVPFYWAKDVHEAQKLIQPYAVLTANADFGTNETVRVSCPIFK